MMQEAEEMCLDLAYSWEYFKQQAELTQEPVLYALTSDAQRTVDERYEVLNFRMFFQAENPRRLLVYIHTSDRFFFADSRRKRREKLFIEACQSVAQEFKATRTSYSHLTDLVSGCNCKFNPYKGKQPLANFTPGPEIEV